MATFKFIEPTDNNIKELQEGLLEADMYCQLANEKIQAASTAICLMLREPDSGALRLQIKTLCEIIEHQAFVAMNDVNSIAEQCGAHYVDELARAEAGRLHAAARGELTDV